MWESVIFLINTSEGGLGSIDLSVIFLPSTLSTVQIGMFLPSTSFCVKYNGDRARSISMYRRKNGKCFVQLRNAFFLNNSNFSRTMGNSFSRSEKASSDEGKL